MMERNKILIELKNVNKNYHSKKVLKNICLTIKDGDRIGVIGPNGAGKSTLSEVIGKIRKPSSGEVLIADDLIVGIQFQESKYPVGINVYDLIKYYLEVYQIAMTEQELENLMRTYQIIELKNRPLEKLSGGQQQRVNILLSLIHNPDFVIFDEISTGLDIEVRQEIFDFIDEHVISKGKSLMLVTHMMSEIEKMCNKFIYVNDGQILASGNVDDLVKEYGSVQNYTWKTFKEGKKQKYTQTKVALEKNKRGKIKNHFDRVINKATNKGKDLPLLKLILKYYLKGIAVPFFLIAFPLIIMFLEGFAFKEMYGHQSVKTIAMIRELVMSVACVGIATVGISVLPQTIIEFKHSVLLKRIGASGTKIKSFVMTILIMNFAFCLFTFFWTVLWGGIMFGSQYGWSQVISFKNVGIGFLFLMILIVTSIAFGLALSSILRSVSASAFITISMMIFIPVSFLSGCFFPMELLENSTVLNSISYINPFKYCINPINQAWMDNIHYNVRLLIFGLVSIGLIVGYFAVTAKRLNFEK